MSATEFTLETRILPGPNEAERMATAELRNAFLAGGLFEPGRMRLVYTELDRLIVGGVVPESETRLPGFHELGTRYFTERREMGVINLGAPGAVVAAGERYELENLDCLYVGAGVEDVRFLPGPAGQPLFYLSSCPAHREYPVKLIRRADAPWAEFGSAATASRRRISRNISQETVESCQLVMGVTELQEGSIWNTMPAHLHSRRSEIYLYFDLGESVLFHFMGPPERTRHVVVRNLEAVLSPSWSIHSGAGTRSYRFVWSMGGENRTIADIDPVGMDRLR